MPQKGRVPPGKPAKPGTPRPVAAARLSRPGARPAAPARGRRAPFRRDFVLTALLGGVVIGLAVAFTYGIYKPKTPWAFDRPEAQLPSLQPRHTLQ